MKLLLLGANGQLGRTFLAASTHARNQQWLAASRDGVLASGGHGVAADLGDPAALAAALDRAAPDVIVNTAAYTAVDQAESDEATAIRINGDAVGVIGAWAASHHALVVHFSTDYVFAGTQPQAYPPDAPTVPVNAYGRSKLAGELALRASGAAHLILRTGWVYAAHGRNFLRSMLRLGAGRDELCVVDDQHGAPTDTTLIVRASLAAIERWHMADAAARRQLEGTHHLVASGVTTWHGFACEIFTEAQAMGLIAHAPRIVAIGSADYPTPARRPAWSVLDNRGFQRQFAFALPDWEQGLHSVLGTLRDTMGP